MKNLIAMLIFLCMAYPVAGQRAKTQLSPITLMLDVREAPRNILHVKMTIPAAPGPLTLLYPKWIPGEHGPTGPITNLAGLKLTAAGKPITWQRDNVEMYALHCEVPAGANSVEATLDFLLPVAAEGFTSASSSTSQLVVINWNQLLLYPAGWTAGELTYTAGMRLPQGWKYGTALPVSGESADIVNFAPVSLTTLVDSPIIAGAHFRTIQLSSGDSPSNQIDIVSDSDSTLEMSPKMIESLRKMVTEADALFGAHHYQHYHFLLTLSNHVAHFGLEHHESNDSRVSERALIDDDERRLEIGVLSHEFIHSWNGKYRRPSGLTTPDFQQPMKGDLLWVYEGLTQYLGNLLAARSGLWTTEEYLENLALIAATLDNRPGRTWRPLADTAVAAQLLYNAPPEWDAWRRDVDFYDEGWLIWLDVDTLIRQKSQGRLSINDFCRRFHGGKSGPPTVVTYNLDDVVTTLNDVVPYDWRTFLTTRINSMEARAPLGGIDRGGWRLVYTDLLPAYLKSQEEIEKTTDLYYSIGIKLKENGTIIDVIPGMAADKAGIGPGMKLIAVNGRRWSPDLIRAALKATKTSSEPLELLVENGEYFKTCRLDYHGGNRYPHLERDTTQPDLLEGILKPLLKN